MKKQNKKELISNNLNDTIEFAYDLAKTIAPKDIICLCGDLGVGKTIIAKSIGKFFNVNDDIISPTFNIVKVYDINNNKIKKINHFDLYRLKTIDELNDIGFEEYIYDDNSITIIEWPEIAYDLIPNNAKYIHIFKLNNDTNKRRIVYEN